MLRMLGRHGCCCCLLRTLGRTTPHPSTHTTPHPIPPDTNPNLSPAGWGLVVCIVSMWMAAGVEWYRLRIYHEVRHFLLLPAFCLPLCSLPLCSLPFCSLPLCRLHLCCLPFLCWATGWETAGAGA